VPDLRHLRAFVAVAEEGGFTRAALRLHLAQQAVSKSVAQLERELGTELLERTSREVRLTDAGAALLADGRAVLDAADAAFARARDHGRGLTGSVAVGTTPAVGTAVLDRMALRLREDAPGLSIAVRDVRPGEIAEALRGRRVDVVLARSAPDGAGLTVATLAPTPAVLVVPAGHRLATAGHAPLAAVDGERLLAWSPPGTPYTDLLTGLCRAAGATVTPVETAVTGGTGLAELPALGAVALVAAGWTPGAGTAAVQLEDPPALPLLAVRRAGAAPPPVRRLVALLAEDVTPS
jgi:DNA-binding transcriptional LysR family regulator